MVIVEFFDRKHPINNVVSALANEPEKVIFIGGSSKQINRELPKYQAFLEASQVRCPEFEVHGVSEHNLNAIVETLEAVVNSCPECCIDLTGGNEVCACAAGVIRERYRDRNIQLHRYNVHTGAVYDCDGDGITPCRTLPSVTVEQYILLHGGGIVSANEEVPFHSETGYASVIDGLWNIAKQDPEAWNNQLALLNEIRTLNTSEDPLEVTIWLKDVQQKLGSRSGTLKPGKVLKPLYQAGFLTDYVYNDEMLHFFYRDEAIIACLDKAGTILELKVWLSAVDAVDDQANALFNDAITGAWLDWDGRDGTIEYDTANEIDVILMKGLYPVFISCKNGKVTEDELYKLDTVAKKFGGEYVRMALIGSELEERLEGSWRAFRQRAEDMGIALLPDAAEWDDETFAEKLRSILC